MLNYVETESRSTPVPLAPGPNRQQPERQTEPRSAMPRPQADPAWSIGKDCGEWLYQGKLGAIRIPGFLNSVTNAAFAQGFWRGRALLLEREDGNWSILTDQQFTTLITQELPATLPEGALACWKRGFIFGWCMTWHSQPFLIEVEEARAEKQARAAATAAGKQHQRGPTSVPKVP